MRQSELDSLANDISNMVVNRVLSGEVSINEALTGMLTAPIFLYAKTLPPDAVDHAMNSGGLLASDIINDLGGKVFSPSALMYSLSLVSRAIIEKAEQEQ